MGRMPGVRIRGDFTLPQCSVFGSGVSYAKLPFLESLDLVTDRIRQQKYHLDVRGGPVRGFPRGFL